MTEKPNRIQPVLVGGLIIGLLSSLPFVSLANCCCFWAILGGAVSARMLISRSPLSRVTSGQGAAVGALAGAVGSLITLVIGVPISILTNSSDTAFLQRAADSSANTANRELLLQVASIVQDHPVLIALAWWLISSLVYTSVAALGGIIGIALFEKRKEVAAPPLAPESFSPPGLAPPGPPPSPHSAPPDQAPFGGGEPPPY